MSNNKTKDFINNDKIEELINLIQSNNSENKNQNIYKLYKLISDLDSSDESIEENIESSEELTDDKTEELTEDKTEELSENQIEKLAENQIEEITDDKTEELTDDKTEELTENQINNLINLPLSPADDFLEDYEPPPEINKLELFYEKINNNEIESLILFKDDQRFINKIIELVQKNNSLKYLFVNMCSFTFNRNITSNDLNFFDALCNNTSITHLCVDYNDFNEESIKSLSELIQNNNTIQYLNLSHCCINNKKLVIICEALKNNNSITDINLSCNDISDINPLYETFKVNKTIKKINLDYNKIKDITPFINIIQNNNTLTDINLCSNEIDDINVICEIIQQNISIEKLNLSHNKFKVIKPLYEILDKHNALTNNPLIKLKLNNNLFEDIEYIDKLLEKNISFLIINKEKTNKKYLKHIVSWPYILKIKKDLPETTILMSNDVRSWYDFEDIISCSNYVIGILRNTLINHDTNHSDENNIDIMSNLSSSSINNILSSGCCIQ